MAVSGRRGTDFVTSISYGSAEDFNQHCDPCLAEGQNEEAFGFCVDCQEHLCKNCFHCHSKTKASKHHQLLDKDNMDKHPTPTEDSTSLVEKCSIHPNELIKFFCPKHEALGCSDCAILEHRTCKVDYIPKICSGIGDSQIFHEIMKQTDDKMKEMDETAKKAKETNQEIDKGHDAMLKDIDKFEKEIIRRIGEMKRKIRDEAQIRRANNKKSVQKAQELCRQMSSRMKEIQTNIMSAKASNQEGQLFILLTKASATLQSSEVRHAQQLLDTVNTRYVFERNDGLDRLIASTDTLGSLKTCLPRHSAPKKEVLRHIADINIRTKSDSMDCDISGCAVLSDGKVVLADYSNQKIKIVGTRRKIVDREKQLTSVPFDVTILPQDHIATTLPFENQILIMDSSRKMTTKYHIPLKQTCNGIFYHDESLYVACKDPHCVLILDTQGAVTREIILDSREVFLFPLYIVYSKDSKRLYINDLKSNITASVRLQGEIAAVFKETNDSVPQGMVITEDGSLLVCYRNGTIHHVSSDLKTDHTVGQVSGKPQAINKRNCEVFIGGYGCNLLKVFSLK